MHECILHRKLAVEKRAEKLLMMTNPKAQVLNPFKRRECNPSVMWDIGTGGGVGDRDKKGGTPPSRGTLHLN